MNSDQPNNGMGQSMLTNCVERLEDEKMNILAGIMAKNGYFLLSCSRLKKKVVTDQRSNARIELLFQTKSGRLFLEDEVEGQRHWQRSD